MSRPIVRPALDPLAHKAAIDALEAQRAAYRRYARTVEAQHHALGNGDGDQALAAVDVAARDFVELNEGARRLEPLVQQVHDAGSADQLQEIQRQMSQLMREARQAENAIRNMTTQLEAWRDAYGRQLAELGLPPGVDPEAPGAAETVPGRRRPYVQPGFGPDTGNARPTLIDKKG